MPGRKSAVCTLRSGMSAFLCSRHLLSPSQNMAFQYLGLRLSLTVDPRSWSTGVHLLISITTSLEVLLWHLHPRLKGQLQTRDPSRPATPPLFLFNLCWSVYNSSFVPPWATTRNMLIIKQTLLSRENKTSFGVYCKHKFWSGPHVVHKGVLGQCH